MIAAVTAMALFAAAPASADPAPFTSFNGSCPDPPGSGQDVFSSPPATSAHEKTLVRVQTSGPAWFSAAFGGPTLTGPDVLWKGGLGLGLGNSVNGTVYCSSGTISYSISVFDIPTAPVSFSGATTASTEIEGGASELIFDVLASGPYVLNLSLSQGSVLLRTSGRAPERFSSSGIYALGDLNPTADRIPVFIEALDGPQAIWNASIAPAPIVISGARFSPTSIEPGRSTRLHYTTNGSTRISAEIWRGGTFVKALASNLSVSKGSHAISWDGMDGGGAITPGRYSAHLRSVDPSGNASTATAALVIEEPTLSLGEANRAMRRTLSRTVGPSFSYADGEIVRCGSRRGALTRKCQIRWFIGDASYRGTGIVRLRPHPHGGDRLLARFRIKVLDEYCRYTLHQSKRKCSHWIRGGKSFRT